MAKVVKDSFLDLERHRQVLEENIDKLRKSLRHWQVWEAEYEGLKEEILAARPTPDRERLVSLAREYEGELVTKKEIEDILGVNTSRSAAQVVNLLDRRIEYVEQNVKTVEKQIMVAENKLATATIISTPNVRNEEGLPLTEIIEELDEEGNVISGRTSTPGSSKPQLLEGLQKAGVNMLPASSDPRTSPAEFGSRVTISPKDQLAKFAQKSVRLSEDAKHYPELQKPQTTKRLGEIMSIAKQHHGEQIEPPIIPTNESPEDAALRREMLQYSMSEIGAVVAELDLDDESDLSDEHYGDDDGSSVDDEDAFGRSTGHIVSDDLRKRMIELENKIGVRMMENIGKNASDYEDVKQVVGHVVNAPKGILTAPDEAQSPPLLSVNLAPGTTASTRKSVKFSDDLDIFPAPLTSTSISERSVNRSALATTPIRDVLERSDPTPPVILTTQKKSSGSKSSKPSTPAVLNGPLATARTSYNGPSLTLEAVTPTTPKRFSTSIQFTSAQERTRVVPSGPQGRTLAPTIVEHDIQLDASAADPDELDPQLLHQEIATEYHRIRNRMIQRQGGFLKEEEGEIVPFTEEEGGPKKMSRFKTARLARS